VNRQLFSDEHVGAVRDDNRRTYSDLCGRFEILQPASTEPMDRQPTRPVSSWSLSATAFLET
jgi:hypothetical protein